MDADTLTVAQAAQRLGVSERTVWRYLRSGRLAGETTGPLGAQRTLIHATSVEGAARARSRDPEADALRAERDALVAERDLLAAALASAEAERDALDARLAVLQRAVARPPRRLALPSRAAGWLMVALSRIR